MRYIEIAKLKQYAAGGTYYRVPNERGIKLASDELVLFAFHAENKLKNLEWQRVGCRMHVFGNWFIRSSLTTPGIEIMRFFVNKTANICPGQPKILLNVDQWNHLMLALKSVHKFLYDTDKIAPCFYQEDHFKEGKFEGCCNCVAFSSDEDKKNMEKKGESSEPPAKKVKAQ